MSDRAKLDPERYPKRLHGCHLCGEACWCLYLSDGDSGWWQCGCDECDGEDGAAMCRGARFKSRDAAIDDWNDKAKDDDDAPDLDSLFAAFDDLAQEIKSLRE